MIAATRGRALPIALLAASLALGASVAAGWESTPRALLAVAFLLAGPGLALVPLLGIEGMAGTLTVAFALSIALDTLVACALLYAGAWSPAVGLAILVAITVAGAAAQLARLAGRESA